MLQELDKLHTPIRPSLRRKNNDLTQPFSKVEKIKGGKNKIFVNIYQMSSKKNLSLSLVRPIKDSHLDKFKRLSKAELEIDDELRKLGNICQVQNIGELVHLIASLVENVTSVKLTGVEKKEFVIKKLTSFHPDYNNEGDLKWINVLIDTLCVVGAIAKVDNSKVVLHTIKSVCSPFFLKP